MNSSMFVVIVVTGSKKYRLHVMKTYADSMIERYEARANNHTFLFEVNRPPLISKKATHLPWQWSQLQGPSIKWFVEDLIKQIEKHLRSEDYFNWQKPK